MTPLLAVMGIVSFYLLPYLALRVVVPDAWKTDVYTVSYSNFNPVEFETWNPNSIATRFSSGSFSNVVKWAGKLLIDPLCALNLRLTGRGVRL